MPDENKPKIKRKYVRRTPPQSDAPLPPEESCAAPAKNTSRRGYNFIEAFRHEREHNENIEAMIQQAKEKLGWLNRRPDGQGRWETWSQEVEDELLLRVSYGQTLRHICSLDGLPDKYTLDQWLYGLLPDDDSIVQRFESLRRKYDAAKAASCDFLADDLILIADEAVDRETAAAAKVRLAARTFILERRLPKAWAQATRDVSDTDDSKLDALADALELIAQRKQQLSVKQEPVPIECTVLRVSGAGDEGDRLAVAKVRETGVPMKGADSESK